MDIADILDFSHSSIGGAMAIVLAVIAIASAIQCFFGYKIFKFWIGVIGFFVFGALGLVLGAFALESSEAGAIVFGLILGVLGAFLAMKMYKLGVFIQCFSTGFIAGIVITGLFSETDLGTIIPVSTILGIIMGVVGVILVKPLIILSTGISGGMSLGICISGFFEGNIYMGTLLGIICSIIGILYQFHIDKSAGSVNNAGIGTVPTYNKHVNVHNDGESEESATEIFSEDNTTVNYTQAKAGQSKSDIGKKMGEMKDEVQKKIQHKVYTDSRYISEEDSRAAAQYIFKGIESLVYSNVIMKLIIPFIEYVLYAITAIFFIKGLFSKGMGYISMTATIVLAIVILLCLVKGKKMSVSVSLAIIAVSQIIGINRLNLFEYLAFKYKFRHILEVAILLGIAASVVYYNFSKKKNSEEAASE